MRWLLSFLFLGLLTAVNALSSSGNRLLVVLDDPSEKDVFSTFWSDLESRGYDLSFSAVKNDELALFQHGVRTYDHLLLLPSKVKALGPALSPKNLLDFVQEDGNILVALSGSTPISTTASSLLSELDIATSPDRSAIVVDHFNYDTLSAPDKHDVLLLPRPSPLRSDVKSYFSGEGVLALPRTVGQALGSNNPLLAPVLRASETAYSYDPRDDAKTVEDPFATGSQLSLVSVAQARNSARVTVLGSAESLEDKWFSADVKGVDGKKAKTANREFAQQLTAWAFKEAGVLKVGSVEHRLNEGGVEEEVNPTIYRIKNDVTFSIELSEYSDDHYIPFEIAPTDAVQLEFTMLSPYHRLSLEPTSRTENSTIYSTSLTLPDQHGIFSFHVNYKRPFLTNVHEKREVTVRHFAHDEYPRSWQISGGWVWIAGLWSVVAGFMAFVVVWLYCEPSSVANDKLKKLVE
ncbi:oligosaccharyl transferase glycoprotein complex, beta subunit [Arachnomyces sp. PD_36]|nr:oligosaccharyl transferase glycoprotein complex, beta subunit [Arachnomyces sp. PD_36]